MKTSTSHVKEKLMTILKKGIAILFWLSLWQIVAMIVNQSLLMPSPLFIFERLYTLVQTSSFWQTTLLSLLRVMAGYFVAIIAGALLAVLTSFSSFFKILFSPLIYIVRATPVASFIILALVWMHSGTVPAFIAGLMVFPLIWKDVSTGIEETPKSLLEMGRVFQLSRTKVLRYIYFPSTFPYFVSGSMTALGFAWKAGIAAEVISAPKHSIGLMLHDSKIYLETVDLFAWTLVVILLSVLLEKGMVFLMNQLKKHVLTRMPKQEKSL